MTFRIAIEDHDYEFQWGQYKGRTYGYVLNRDPHYIQWIYNQGNLDLNEKLMDELREKLNEK